MRRGRASSEFEGEEGHGSSSERWLVSYADFITLMFAFFAVLYATSQHDNEKAKEFQESIKRFLIKSGGVGGGGAAEGTSVNQATKGNTPIEPPIQSYNPGKPETIQTLDEAEKFFSEKLSKAEQRKYVRDLLSDDWGVRIVLPAQELYSNGSDKFRPEALPFINKLTDLMKQTKRKILIEGHVAAGEKGSSKSTWEFSSQRSLNLLRFVQARSGLASQQLAAAALGDSRPLYQDRDPQQNSRIEVVLLSPEMEF